MLKNYYPSGKLSLIDNFKDGKQHGEFKRFYENGNILMRGLFSNGKQDGLWEEFHEDGSVYWKLRYNKGQKKTDCLECFIKTEKLCQELLTVMGNQYLIGYILTKQEKNKVNIMIMVNFFTKSTSIGTS